MGTEGSQPAGQGQTPPAATPPTPGQVAAQGAAAEPPQYVTRADLEEYGKQLLSKAQSMDGKAYNAIQEQIKTLKAAGIEATPDQVRKLIENQQQGTNQGSAQPPAPDQTPPAATPPTGTQQPTQDPQGIDANQVTLQAYKMMAEKGVILEDGDPEIAKIRQDGTPEEWLADVGAALDAKAERLQREGNPARMPILGGGGAVSQPAHATLSGTDTIDTYWRTKR